VPFIILLGIVSLFGDVTYEGARAVTGPYLGQLGASAFVVSSVGGIGDFLGYALRLASGRLADRTRAYWLLTFIGYGLILSIPLLAFAGHWQLAVVLIILERVGKAIRSPARDTMLSYATKKVGRGWGFAVHEALDQVGAVIGPIAFSVILFSNDTFQQGFMFLGIPALLTMTVLGVTRKRFPSPVRFEAPEEPSQQATGTALPRIFWLYTAFALVSAAGLANFQLISLHLADHAIVADAEIPIIYAIAMGVDAVAALVIGRIYDRVGLASLLAIPLLTLPIAFFAFSQSYSFVLIGMALWGVVLGIHETIMRAAVADLTPVERRGSAYGIYTAMYGAGWGVGGVVMGLLYSRSISYLIVFSAAMELASIPLLLMVRRQK
jgi:predicted MFS family arabinose efflux permease